MFIKTKLTLGKIESTMREMEFEQSALEELMVFLEERLKRSGERAFRKWLKYLHYRVPEGYKDEQIAIAFYERHSLWIECEVIKLEQETKRPWEIQAEDLQELDPRAQKAQLVIRHRLSEVVLELR
ncbi:hypothetical protein D1B31_13075 [Neobacillus notoginsengisoli]|uniref:Uncharacterized protein n=1 Tax=Neobacillus notoginsengisoli TaxID=1578198 RepID=A0A417YSG2_9BACI|nr:hypothetical protein D1B31_13075 [Neobacillus notoginsengisoli]